MAWDHLTNPGGPARLQRTGTGSLVSGSLATHVSAATITGNAVDGIIVLTADGTGGSTGKQAAFTFANAELAAHGHYAVIVTPMDLDVSTTGTVTGTTWSGAVVTVAGVAQLQVDCRTTGLTASATQALAYSIRRVG